MASDPWDVIVGVVTTVFGIMGELKVRPLTDYPERFDTLRQVCLRPPQKGESASTEDCVFQIERIRHHKGAVLLKLRDVDSVEDAEVYRGFEVTVRRSERVKLPKGSYFLDDIIGLEVVTTDGESLGKITDVMRAGANDVYETPLAMIPAAREFVQSVDLEKGVMVVKLVEGLLK